MELLNHSMDFLNYPIFVINMKSQKDKWTRTNDMLKKYGFTHVIRFDAIEYNQDKNNSENNMQDENGIPTNEKVIQDIWNDVGNPILKKNYSLIDQAYCINHLLCLKMIIYNNIQHACITFDDIALHDNWDTLAPIYWKYTPKDFDVCVLGADFSLNNKENIKFSCDHGNNVVFNNIYFYIVSLSGANKLVDTLVKQPCESFLDSFNNKKNKNIHVWNAFMFKNYKEDESYDDNLFHGIILNYK